MARRQAGDGRGRDLLVRGLQEASSVYAAYYRHVTKAEKTGEREVTFTFDGPAIASCRRSSASSTCCRSTGGKAPTRRQASATSPRPRSSRRSAPAPTASRASCRAARIVYERVKDYWGKDLNVNVGRDNFDELRFEYFRDATVALEAFKADAIDWRTENSAKNWATAYDFPAVQGQARRPRGVPDPQLVGVMQAFAFNMRRDKFKDPRVRRAFNYAFDFEEMNKQLFFGQYKRITSYFEGTRARLVAACRRARSSRSSKPCATRCRRRCSPRPTAIRSAARPRRCATTCARRRGCCARPATRSATRSWSMPRPASRSRSRFLIEQPEFERFVLPYKPALERLGIRCRVRTVDDAQYENRLRQLGLRHHRRHLGPVAVARQRAARLLGLAGRRPAGLAQLVGIKNPAVDALIDRVIFAKNRDELVAATKALDRVLLWNHYVVPQWTYGKVAHRALGPLRPARQAAEIRRARPSRRSGGGTQAKAAKTGIALVTGTRRAASCLVSAPARLRFGASAARCVRRRPPPRPSATACRRSAT